MVRGLIASFFFVCCLSIAAPAAAQESLDERRNAAQTLADNAFDLMQKGLHEEAAGLFRKADERFHSPVFVLFEAQAWEKHGRLLKARALLKRIIDEEIADLAPQAFRDAKKKARKRLRTLDAKIPTITIRVPGLDPNDVTITIDGEPVPADQLGIPLQVHPHQPVVVSAEGPDGRSAQKTVQLDEGDQREIELALAAPSTEETMGDDASAPYWVPAAVAFGIGGVGLIVGAVVGGVFVGKADALKEKCDDTLCDPALESEGDDVKMLGNVSTAMFVVGGVGVAAGIVLLLVLDDGATDGADAAFLPSIAVTPDGLAVRSRF